ncbi:MAG: hypothetical protein JW787_11210 [Sedimentisphaerales bacterium]|nr:hypothetical protein [Sedimentisphaerales bacterium]
MTEVYPTDNELENIQSDSETGVEYIPTGTSPYYLQFRKLLYRLLSAARRANDLRVYKEEGLNIGVKAGKFWVGTELVSYPGSSGNSLADDKEDIYIYLNSSGVLVSNEYDGFPDMAVTPHIRLAVVSTSDGDINSITDSRSGHNIMLPFGAGGIKKYIESHDIDDTLTPSESGSVHTNYGAAMPVVITLPEDAPEGTVFTFAVQAAYELRIDPDSATIRDSCGQTSGKYKYAGTIGDCITLIADENCDWVTIAKNGSWNEEI